MREELVIGAKAGVDDDLACRGIDGLTFNAGPGGRQRRVLRAAFDLEYVLHLVGRLAEHERAADVRLVPFDDAAAVDQENRAFANDLRRDGAVRECRELPDLHAGLAVESEPGVRGAYELAEFVLRHALAK